ncbi:SIR2 family NAD-dependent protein deacylase [Caldinitratiruptor microaerophilus]|uniref:protein acetyllysine N-acetyltransferase n=1 Tax=Caldinitratiruptor microaerophilus TaxID=671077 RepID=A0AA35CIB9_9FIRM|nr:NAD-dependent deacylase [Caldinitratiruptor microaerophilus]BDG58974.1 NAD-dependent deacetylase [Caldinitratiruptor microaerophilus]
MSHWTAALHDIATALVRSERKATVLTGAGISIPSGVPSFRGEKGLWERYDPAEYAHIDAFHRQPARVWQMLRELRQVIERARPNPAHLALARLEELGYLRAVVTQNVDGLHQAAGSRDVVELHGSYREVVCLACGARYPWDSLELLAPDETPPRCTCGGLLKPDVVLFGELLPRYPLIRAWVEAQNCDTLLVIGTSAEVEPAASLPAVARNAGARIVEINPHPALDADFTLAAPAEEVLPRLVEVVEEIRGTSAA